MEKRASPEPNSPNRARFPTGPATLAIIQETRDIQKIEKRGIYLV